MVAGGLLDAVTDATALAMAGREAPPGSASAPMAATTLSSTVLGISRRRRGLEARARSRRVVVASLPPAICVELGRAFAGIHL